jgi:hypothetical protein
MTMVLQAALDYAAPLPPKDQRHQLKAQFIQNTVTELALVSLCTGLSCYFAISNELRWAFIKKGATVLGVNTVVRTVATACRYAAISERGLFFRTVSFSVDCIAPFYFAREFNPFYFIIHEGGHVVSTYLLSQKSTIQVFANSMWQWHTQSTMHGLSKLGSYLGQHNVKMVITAGGALATVMTNQITLIAALVLKDSYPEFSKYLFFPTLSSLFKEFTYAQSAFDTASAPPGHDFVILWKEGGIHPYTAMTGMIALPLITTLGFLGIRYRL